MRIQRPLLKLPIRFCADTLAHEVRALPAAAWVPHPQKLDGNIAVQLVSPGGAPIDDWAGPMAPTENLRRCPYIMEVMAELDATWGRSRLMGLEAGADVPPHVDVHYYWRTHLRIHIPVITNPQVRFTCEGETVHMKAGECWLLDSFHPHTVQNLGEDLRIHLVLDTVGSGPLWDMIDAALRPEAEVRFSGPNGSPRGPLQFEQINAPDIMSPWEIKCHIAYMYDWMDEDPRLPAVERILDRFVASWSGSWARFGASDDGIPSYLRHLGEVKQALASVSGPPILMRNRWPLLDSLQRYVLANAIAPAKLQHLRAKTAHQSQALANK